jgi:DNA modification methylase
VSILQYNSQYRDKGLSNFAETALLPRHRWYYFKEGYSSTLVNEALTLLSGPRQKRLRILDPFCGSGTTALSSALSGHACTSIEVNPFLHFAAKVKSKGGRIYENVFSKVAKTILIESSSGIGSTLEKYSTFSSGGGGKKYLFNRSVIRRFTAVQKAIGENESAYSDIFRLAAISAALDCCNAKRDGKALRYIKKWNEINFNGDDFILKYKEKIDQIVEDVRDKPIDQAMVPKIIRGDSRAAVKEIDDEFDLLITSPPYLNSFDYSDVYRPELFLGGYVEDNHQLRTIRHQTVRSHVQVDWDRDIETTSSLLTPIIDKLSNGKKLWSVRLPLMIQAYFDDLAKVLRSSYGKLRKNGQAWIVVSTSAYAGVEIPVDLILADIASSLGYKLDSIHCLRQLRTAGQQWRRFKSTEFPLRESLIILKK